MMATDDTEVSYARDLVRFDWLTTKRWNRLHFADLDEDQVQEIADATSVAGPVRLACGRTAASVWIPGLFTRMGAQRCKGCCRALGYPQGKGSPKNDDPCRVILGLPCEEAKEAKG